MKNVGGVHPGEILCVALILAAMAGLLARSAAEHSPVPDEPGHLVAGLSCWQLGRYELYRVNPPLVRMIAALPVWAMGPATRWQDFDPWPGRRSEFLLGGQFVAANPDRWPTYFMVARWALIPFVVLGGLVCWWWARALGGVWAGLGALLLWCTSPEVLAHGALITPDASAASFGVLAGYCFWTWLRKGSSPFALGAGVATGLALLTKLTWIVLIPTWPLIWWLMRAQRSASDAPRATAGQLAMLLATSLFVVNLFYCCDGSFTSLGDYTFVSGTLSGVSDVRTMQLGGNRFRDTWIGSLPLPLPREYVQGLDCQQLDFDHGDWSFLCGEWRLGGWWYYYLAAMLFKLPAAGGLLFAAAVWGMFGTGKHAVWRDQLALLLPAGAVFAVASAQTGFNHHFRYVLPALPYLFVWASVNATRALWQLRWPTRWFGAAALGLLYAGYAIESLSIYPHSLSFFNLLVGGPRAGSCYLSNSCIDWGQDLYLLRQWHAAHPEARPFYSVCYSPTGQVIENDEGDGGALGAEPYPLGSRPGLWTGWHAVSVTAMQNRDPRNAYWNHLTPVDQIGYSILIFHITAEDVRRLAPLFPME